MANGISPIGASFIILALALNDINKKKNTAKMYFICDFMAQSYALFAKLWLSGDYKSTSRSLTRKFNFATEFIHEKALLFPGFL